MGGEDDGGVSGGEGGSSVTTLSFTVFTKDWPSGAIRDGVHTCSNHVQCVAQTCQTTLLEGSDHHEVLSPHINMYG